MQEVRRGLWIREVSSSLEACRDGRVSRARLGSNNVSVSKLQKTLGVCAPCCDTMRETTRRTSVSRSWMFKRMSWGSSVTSNSNAKLLSVRRLVFVVVYLVGGLETGHQRHFVPIEQQGGNGTRIPSSRRARSVSSDDTGRWPVKFFDVSKRIWRYFSRGMPQYSVRLPAFDVINIIAAFAAPLRN